MSTRIKGITVEIGGDTTGLSKALSGINKNITTTQNELRDVERLLKLDPTNTELLNQKFKLLSTQVGATETKLDALKEAERQVQQQFAKGEASEQQYNALKREIIDVENKLSGLKTAAQSADAAIKSINDASLNDVKSAAGKAGAALKDAKNDASNFGDYLKAGAIVEGAAALASTMKSVAEETKEYQKIMASLEVSSQKAGYSAEETAESYALLYGYLGDDQTTATTLSNLQKMGLKQDQLNNVIKGSVGAWAEYADSIPIDGLAESINETVKMGEVTGNLADVLNWADGGQEAFNEKLAATSLEAERAKIILGEFQEQGLLGMAEAWQENNEALYENNQQNAELQEQMGKLGEAILPILTQITTAVTNLLTWFNQLDPTTQKVIIALVALTAIIGPLAGGINNIISLASSLSGGLAGLSGAFSGMGSVIMGIISNPITLIIAAIIALVVLLATKGDEIQGVLKKVDDFLQGVFVKDWEEVFGPVLGRSLNLFFDNVKIIWDMVRGVFDGMIDFVRGVFTGDWSRAWEGIVGVFSSVFNGLSGIAKMPLNGIISLINGAIGGINTLINGFNNIPGVPNIGKIPSITYLAKGGSIQGKGQAIVGEAGPELMTVSGNKTTVEPLSKGTNTKMTNMGGVSINVYGAPGQSEEELAKIISEEIGNITDRKGAVYA